MGLEGSGCKAFDGGKNFVARFLLVEGLGLLIVVKDEVLDGGGELTDACVASALDFTRGEQREPSLDLIEPGGVCGREMQMKAWPFLKPSFDQVGLVRGIVVEDEVDIELFGHRTFHQVEEAAKLLTAVL